jgi:hypothetical protein
MAYMGFIKEKEMLFELCKSHEVPQGTLTEQYW